MLAELTDLCRREQESESDSEGTSEEKATLLKKVLTEVLLICDGGMKKIMKKHLSTL